MINKNMIAPCGMNCALCAAYLRENNKCPGCRQMSEDAPKTCRQCRIRKCEKRSSEYCFSCDEFPCDRLKHLDERYRSKYHMSEIDNLNEIKEIGIKKFLSNQEKQWKCPTCSGIISCHNGLCYNCDKEKLNNKRRKYSWD